MILSTLLHYLFMFLMIGLGATIVMAILLSMSGDSTEDYYKKMIKNYQESLKKNNSN